MFSFRRIVAMVLWVVCAAVLLAGANYAQDPPCGPSPEWIDIMCDSSHMSQGDIVDAYDPDGTLCVQYVIEADGSFGFMPIYRDDPFTECDEGAVTGDLISFTINGMNAISYPALIYPSSYDMIEICFSGSGLEVFPTTLSFDCVAGEGNPPMQTVTILQPEGWPVTYMALTTTSWIIPFPPESVTPNLQEVWVDITGMGPGNYSGSVVVTSEATTDEYIVTVNLHLGQGNQAPVIAIKRATMVSPHGLGLDLEVMFPPSDDPEQRRFVRLSAIVNGQPISEEFDITNLVGPGEEGKVIAFSDGANHGADPRVLDFAKVQLPRFETNQEFELIADAFTIGGLTSKPDTQKVEVVLPVIIVHGYMGPRWWEEFIGRTGGPIVYAALAEYLHDQTEGDFITGYTTDAGWYKTLWMEDYPSRRFTPQDAEEWLENIVDRIHEETYADRVNLVCHSLGGLVGRYYSWHSKKAASHKVIMIGTPNHGSSKYYVTTSGWKLKKVTNLNEQPLARWLIPNRCLDGQGEFDCIYDWTGETVMPDLAVVRPDADWAYPEEFEDEIDPPDGVTYYSIYGVGLPTPDNLVVELQTHKTGTWYLVVNESSSAGDGVVPWHSANLPSAVSISVATITPHALLPADPEVQIQVFAALGLGQEVAAGVTDLSTESIAYKQGSILESYILNQNHPNPFNPATKISFSLPAASHVRLEVYNIMGQKVATLVDGQLETGEHIVLWDGGRTASGVYLYRLKAGEFVETRKMLLLK